MKIYINLLPQQIKQEIKRKKMFRQILREEVLFLLPIIVFIFVLFNVYYVLTIQRDVFIQNYSLQQSQESYKNLSLYEEKFKQINGIDESLGKIQSQHLYWQNLFQQLSAVVPNGIYISDLSTKNYNVFLLGKAKNREDLINFKNQLETDTCFQNVNVPLSNLVVKNDIDFQIDFVITVDCLKKQ